MTKEELERLMWIYNELIVRYPIVYRALKGEYNKSKKGVDND